MESARELEKDGGLADAGVIYEKILKKDPGSEPAIERLLILYRKLKDYRRELSVLDGAIAEVRRRQKAVREQWIQSHPQAASAGRSMFRQLEKGGTAIMGSDDDPTVQRWIKRRELVAGRISGKKGQGGKGTPRQEKEALAAKKKAAEGDRQRPARPKKEEKERKAAGGAGKDAEKEKRRAGMEKRKAEQVRRKAEKEKRKGEQQRKAEIEKKKAEKAREMTDAERQKLEAGRRPSLFVVILRYLVPLEEIDAAMKQHILYLDKHFAARDFLVSGRQVPRAGGIILARGKNRAAVEKIIKQDPFLKRGLASADIIEFSISQAGKELRAWLHLI